MAFCGGGFAPVLIGWLGQRMSLGMALSSTSLCSLVAGLLILLDCALFRKDMARLHLQPVLLKPTNP